MPTYFWELKWPNILLNKKKKIAGILVESISMGISVCINGVGININNYPMINNRQIIPSSLLNEGIKITDEQKFFNQLINQFNDKYKMWLQDKNFTPIKNAWLSRAYKLGSEINMKLDGETRRGIFRGIAMDGRLIMQMLNNGDMIYYHNGELT
ncbi:MAG: hypothetical protein H6909_00045 [Rickettsiaceae bacterium]|nr:hypothetical protein [Rickettsiaceae bacterium]